MFYFQTDSQIIVQEDNHCQKLILDAVFSNQLEKFWIVLIHLGFDRYPYLTSSIWNIGKLSTT